MSLQENEEKPDELFPGDELRFFSERSDDVVRFELDGGGRVAQLVIPTGGQTIPVKRTIENNLFPRRVVTRVMYEGVFRLNN